MPMSMSKPMQHLALTSGPKVRRSHETKHQIIIRASVMRSSLNVFELIHHFNLANFNRSNRNCFFCSLQKFANRFFDVGVG